MVKYIEQLGEFRNTNPQVPEYGLSQK